MDECLKFLEGLGLGARNVLRMIWMQFSVDLYIESDRDSGNFPFLWHCEIGQLAVAAC